ncbi:MAG: DUF4433 domain-containing protein [Candidatus Omnitrophica bacterium]|nr:DUF4433 domain-containing protein [Candidatus Omnitrophota bacterium]
MSNGLFYKDEYLFHITHIKNLPAILKKGILCKNQLSVERIGYVDVADSDIQQVRAHKCIPGTEYTLHDCVPLFFGARPPMLLALKARGILQEEIVYIVVDWNIIKQPTTWFTDGNARSIRTTEFFQGISHIDKIDCDAVDAYYWSDKGDDFKRKKQAEVLKLNKVSLDEIAGFIVYNNIAKEKVTEILNSQQVRNKDVVVGGGFYY